MQKPPSHSDFAKMRASESRSGRVLTSLPKSCESVRRLVNVSRLAVIALMIFGPLAAYGLVSDPELAATQAAVAAETPMGPLE